MRPRHKCKETELDLKRLETAGWMVIYPSGHWGRVACGRGCRIGIYGTPRDCTAQARIVERVARRCPHGRNDF
jgi:hypothetical protein